MILSLSHTVSCVRQGRSQRFYQVEAHQKHLENCNCTFQIAKNKSADQTAQMHRLVCAFVVHKQQSKGFSSRDPYDVEAQASWPPPGYGPVRCGT